LLRGLPQTECCIYRQITALAMRSSGDCAKRERQRYPFEHIQLFLPSTHFLRFWLGNCADVPADFERRLRVTGVLNRIDAQFCTFTSANRVHLPLIRVENPSIVSFRRGCHSGHEQAAYRGHAADA
jgi:hypothetical protein